MRTSTSRLLVPLLSSQDGVLHPCAAGPLGLADDLLDHEVRAGRWRRLAPEVVLAVPGPPGQRQLSVAALLHGGPRSALTGRVACRLHGLRDVPDGGRVALLLPADVRRTVPPWLRVVRTHATVCPATPSAAWWWGAPSGPCSTPPATVRGGARSGPSCWPLSRTGGPTPRGCGPASTPGPGGGARTPGWRWTTPGAGPSAPEAELADLVRPVAARRRLEVLLDPALLVDGLLLGRVDLYLPALALGVEVDSRRHHAGVDDLDATLRRPTRSAAAGVRLLHVTPRRLRTHPREVREELRTAARTAWPVPPGLEVRPHRVTGA